MNTEQQQQQQHSISSALGKEALKWRHNKKNVKMAAVYLIFLTYFVLDISLTKKRIAEFIWPSITSLANIFVLFGGSDFFPFPMRVWIISLRIGAY